jgi:PAB-dependent poly(A)-specific ribonuclease subunit 3
VVYPYHPNARTLFDAHFKPKPPTMHQGRLQASPTMIPEQTLWSYIIQIAGAIKKVHDAGCALRMIDVTKILVTGKNRFVLPFFTCKHLLLICVRLIRVRVSSCGIVDVLMYDARQDLVLLQQEDLAMFGRLLFALSCNNVAAVNNLPKSLETLSRLYSQDLQKVALWLIQKPGPHKVRELIPFHSLINRTSFLS